MSTSSIQPGWFSIPGAARYTGFTRPTIQKAIRVGALPKKEVRIGDQNARASVRIKREHLDAWIEGREIPKPDTASPVA